MATTAADHVQVSNFAMQVTAALLVIVTLLVAVLLFLFNRNRGRSPPGPTGVPVMGYLPFLDKEIHLTFNNLRDSHGDVIKLSFGSWPAVVISGYDVIREALVGKGDDFSGRPAFLTAGMLNGGRSFGLGPFDAVWKMQHVVVKAAMSKFISEKTTLVEDVVRAEVGHVISTLTSQGEGGVCPKDSVSVATSSIMYQLCYGQLDKPWEDKGFLDQLAGEKNVLDFKKGNLLDFLPWLRHVQRNKVDRFRDIVSDIETRRAARISEHEASFDESNLRDLADYLIQAGRTLSDADRAVGLDKQRVAESVDFLKQAQGSTGTALEWLLLLMAAHPEVQERVFEEIREVVGQDRAPSIADRGRLNVTEATIVEGLRYAAPVPLAIPHCTTCDTTLQGYDIQQDTLVFFNLSSIYWDRELWGDPDTFRPQRFLTSEGKLDTSLTERVSAFSMGRRSCTGQTLARMELFLFFATFMQRVQLSRPPGHSQYSMKGFYYPTRKPLPFQICIAARTPSRET